MSDQEGVCGAETCPLHGTPLTPCDCEDGAHHGAMDQDASDEEKEGEDA